MIKTGIRLSAVLAALVLASPLVASEDKAPVQSLRIELNKLAVAGEGCRMTFVAANRTGSELRKAAFEVVLFDTKELVDRLTVFNFGELPDGKTVVKQFDLKDKGCGSFSRVLINGAASCEGLPGGTEACNAALETANRTNLQFGK